MVESLDFAPLGIDLTDFNFNYPFSLPTRSPKSIEEEPRRIQAEQRLTSTSSEVTNKRKPKNDVDFYLRYLEYFNTLLKKFNTLHTKTKRQAFRYEKLGKRISRLVLELLSKHVV